MNYFSILTHLHVEMIITLMLPLSTNIPLPCSWTTKFLFLIVIEYHSILPCALCPLTLFFLFTMISIHSTFHYSQVRMHKKVIPLSLILRPCFIFAKSQSKITPILDCFDSYSCAVELSRKNHKTVLMESTSNLYYLISAGLSLKQGNHSTLP